MAIISKINSSIIQLKNKVFPHVSSSKATRVQSFTHDYAIKQERNLLHDFTLELTQNTDISELAENEQNEKENKISFFA